MNARDDKAQDTKSPPGSKSFAEAPGVESAVRNAGEDPLQYLRDLTAITEESTGTLIAGFPHSDYELFGIPAEEVETENSLD